MFEEEILKFGFQRDSSHSYKLEVGNLVFLYIYRGGEMYYRYYGILKKLDPGFLSKFKQLTEHDSETNRNTFIEMISYCLSNERDIKINKLLDYKT